MTPYPNTVFTRSIEGMELEVAVHNSLTGSPLISGARVLLEAELAELVFRLWKGHRSVFGGYPYDRFVTVIRGPGDEPLGNYLNSIWGLEVSTVGFQLGGTQESEPPHGATDPFAYDFISHELVHTWKGGIIARVPRPDIPFQPETWFVEGVTIYYTARSNPDREGLHEDILGGWYEEYQAQSAEDRVLSFEKMGAWLGRQRAGACLQPICGPAPGQEWRWLATCWTSASVSRACAWTV